MPKTLGLLKSNSGQKIQKYAQKCTDINRLKSESKIFKFCVRIGQSSENLKNIYWKIYNMKVGISDKD